jgi:hypothetical protein
MRQGLILLLAVVLVAGLSWTSSDAQVIDENHYLVYQVPEVFTVTGQILLADQFNDYTTTFVTFDKFANPVSKNGEPMFDDLLHQTWWLIDDPVPPCSERLVALDNQFGRQDWLVDDGLYLVLPATKDMPGVPPPTWNHYKCYDAIGPVLNTPVVLMDQFGTYNMTVTEPVLFCNPCLKEFNGEVHPIVNPEAHLACYLLEGDWTPVTHMPWLYDQFGEWQIHVHEPCWLCVPSLKLTVVGMEQSTWGSVKSLYR